jgi:glycosyltransferase involved in cell wall biosynthesis
MPSPQSRELMNLISPNRKFSLLGQQKKLFVFYFSQYNRRMNLSVLIPVYNEKKTIQEIINRVDQLGLAKEIVIVDDGSKDGTRDLLRKIESNCDTRAVVRVFYHDQNMGKGAAVRTAIDHAKGEVMLIQDADLEYDPRDYPALLKPLEENIADVVYGSRFLGGPRRPILFWNMVANKILTLTTNILYNNILTDMETGYKVFRRDVVKDLVIHARGFEFEPEFTAKILKRKVRIYEVPISFNPRDYADGKKIKMRDAFIAMWTLVKFRFVD